MRFSIGLLTCLSVAGAISLAAAAATAKPAKGTTPVPPKAGIKTPGVQIPFSQLKPDATLETPEKPTWMYFATAGGGRGGGAGAGAPGGGGRGGGGRGGGGGGRGGGGAPAGGPPAATGGPAEGDLYVPAADKFLKFDTKTGKAADPIAVKKPCGGVVNAFANLWVVSCGDGTLLRMDARTMKPKTTIATGAVDVRGSIAASADSIWLMIDAKQTIVRIDPDQDAVVGELRVPPGCGNMIFAETALWLTCPEQGKILKINPVTNLVDKRIDVGAKPLAMVSASGSIWVLCGKEGKLDRIDPKTDKVTKTLDLGTPDVTGGMVFGDGYLWVTTIGFPLTRLDISETDKERVAQQFWGEGGGAILSSAGSLWISNLNNGTISRIDPKLVLATLAE